MFKLLERIFRKKAQAATAEFREHLRRVRSSAQPLRVELIPSSDALWLDAAAIRAAVGHLMAAGFQSAGVLAVKGNDKTAFAGFAAPAHGALATLFKTSGTPILAISSHFTDGSVFECSSMPMPFEPPCPEWFVRHRFAGATPQVLWSNFLAQRPAKPIQPVDAESVPAANADDFFRYQSWMAERGGTTRNELAIRYNALGKLPIGSDATSFLDMARNDEIERSLCNWWRLQSEAPYEIEQIASSLLIIHDEMSTDLLINAFWCGTDDFKVKDSDFDLGSPRAAFAKLNAAKGEPLRKIFEKRTPLAADFYLPRR